VEPSVRKIPREEVDAMLAEAAAMFGHTKAECDFMWTDGTLYEPELRDLWLIWSDVPAYGSAPRRP
jgi:hypothetical protein